MPITATELTLIDDAIVESQEDISGTNIILDFTPEGRAENLLDVLPFTQRIELNMIGLPIEYHGVLGPLVSEALAGTNILLDFVSFYLGEVPWHVLGIILVEAPYPGYQQSCFFPIMLRYLACHTAGKK